MANNTTDVPRPFFGAFLRAPISNPNRVFSFSPCTLPDVPRPCPVAVAPSVRLVVRPDRAPRSCAPCRASCPASGFIERECPAIPRRRSRRTCRPVTFEGAQPRRRVRAARPVPTVRRFRSRRTCCRSAAPLPISAKRAARGAFACPLVRQYRNRAPLAVHVRADSCRIAACGLRAAVRLVARPDRAPRPCAPCRASRGRPASSSNRRADHGRATRPRVRSPGNVQATREGVQPLGLCRMLWAFYSNGICVNSPIHFSVLEDVHLHSFGCFGMMSFGSVKYCRIIASLLLCFDN